MKIVTNQIIKGFKRETKESQQDWSNSRIHANEGDILHVIFINPTHYICESKYYEGEYIPVFFKQCSEVVKDKIIHDEHELEKYYNVYEEPTKTSIDDPFYSAFEFEDNE